MGEVYKEEDFYKDNGWPTEELSYCHYKFYLSDGSDDYDQFVLIANALYPYIRLTKKRGNCQSPCGLATVVATDGSFARKNEKERDLECPKVAWGFAAVFISELRYDNQQMDYVPLKDRDGLFRNYYDKYLQLYLQNHSGLKYLNVTNDQKELDFLGEHETIIRSLWEKSEPLKNYPELYEYAVRAEADYERFLANRREEIRKSIDMKTPIGGGNKERRTIIQNGEKSLYVENNAGTIIIGSEMSQRNSFSTEIREASGKKYVKVFFLDDAVAADAKAIIDCLNVVKTSNITPSQSKDHKGNTLTIYPKSMVTAEDCQKDVVAVLTQFFSKTSVGTMTIHNEAYFAGIEKRLLSALDDADATIDVCVAWFTNPTLRDKLLEKGSEGIEVRVIIYKDGVNHSKGVDLTGLKHKEYRGERGGILHDKFCIIDNVHTICGSYNWTLNAENKNDEDATFHFEDYKLASTYTRRFNEMWRRDGSVE